MLRDCKSLLRADVMNFPRHIMSWLAGIMACFLVSCIDGREEVWMEPDGSGRAEITYSFPAKAARLHGGADGVRRMVGDFLAKNPGISSSTHDVIPVGDRLKVRVLARFDSVLALRKVTAAGAVAKLPPAAKYWVGEVDYQINGRTVDFARTLSPGLSLPGASFMPASVFEGRSLVYIIHLPMAPQSSNANRTENSGQTLVWEVPLAQALRKPVSTRFVTRIPIPGWLLGVAFPLGGLLLFFSMRALRRLGKMRRSPARSAADSTPAADDDVL